MKNILRTLIVLLGTAVLFAACDKKETVTAYKTGNAPVLSSSTLTVAPAPADSNKTMLNLSWTNPGFATDSSSEKYIIQIDSAGKNFANPYSLKVSGALDTSFIAKQFNSILLGFGFEFGIAYSVDVRIVASYANNNDQKISNVLTIKATPYKIPPKIPVPANLYIVGDAVDLAPGSGWSNPVNAPYQQLTQLDETTFGGIFNLDAGKSFLFLPVNGSWDHKYGGASATGGNLFVDGDVPGNTPAPSTSGWYVVIVNFQTGTYSITPHLSGPSLPDSLAVTGSGLWIIGDATPESPAWTNDPASLAKQQFTRLSNSEYQVTLSLSSTGQYLFLPVAGSWDNKYACDNTGSQPVTGGAFGIDASSNFPGPSTTGNYLIDVNFVTGKYILTPH